MELTHAKQTLGYGYNAWRKYKPCPSCWGCQEHLHETAHGSKLHWNYSILTFSLTDLQMWHHWQPVSDCTIGIKVLQLLKVRKNLSGIMCFWWAFFWGRFCSFGLNIFSLHLKIRQKGLGLATIRCVPSPDYSAALVKVFTKQDLVTSFYINYWCFYPNRIVVLCKIFILPLNYYTWNVFQ